MRSGPARKILDCLIVGAGPAGLSAALYLARFKRRIAVIDSNQSRALWIPRSRNIFFFGEGISGAEILRSGRVAVEHYGVRLSRGVVTALERAPWGFRAKIKGPSGLRQLRSSRFVLLATGAEDTAPDMPDVAKAVKKGLIRYCPVCDGFEASDRHVAVLGRGDGGLREAEFLIKSGFSQVTLLSYRSNLRLSKKDSQSLASAGVTVVPEPVVQIQMRGRGLAALTARFELHFDTVYGALGLNARCSLARGLGARCDQRPAPWW